MMTVAVAPGIVASGQVEQVEFTYDQLDESAQEKARAWYLQHYIYDDQDWCDCTIEDWKTKLAGLGFDDAVISYSGFSSQGDGASFTANINPSRLTPPKQLAKKLDEARMVAKALARLNSQDRKSVV